MILASHNANLVDIASPAVPADPSLGIEGTDPFSRWSGIAQAYVQDTRTETVNGGARIIITESLVNVPANLPVWPLINDVITVNKLPRLSQPGYVLTLQVREVNDHYLTVGFIQLTCRKS